VLTVKAIKVIVFWLIMVLAVVVLWQTIRRQPSRWIPEGLGIVAFVVLVQVGLNRVPAPKRRTVSIMVASGLWAIGAGGLAAFKFLLVRRGFDGREGLLEAVLLFVACSTVSVWSFLHLRRIGSG
jgi:hypothetical protein